MLYELKYKANITQFIILNELFIKNYNSFKFGKFFFFYNFKSTKYFKTSFT